MKIGLLAIGDFTQASTWYRIGQYIPYLQSRGHSVEKFEWNKASTYDLVFVQKVLLPRCQAKKLKKLAKKIIFDFDDAIWTRPGKDYSWPTKWRVNRRLNFWLEKADIVLTPNKFLQSRALQYREKCHLLPMAIDLKPYKKKESFSSQLGWSGAPHNLPYVESILPALCKVNAPLAIYSGKKPSFACRHVPFTVGGESHFLEQVGIGLLPLPQDAYAKGKSPIKALQYMAAGIPFVYSGEGGIDEMVDSAFAFKAQSEEEWVAHLTHLVQESTSRKEAGELARHFVEKRFCSEKLQVELETILSAAL